MESRPSAHHVRPRPRRREAVDHAPLVVATVAAGDCLEGAVGERVVQNVVDVSDVGRQELDVCANMVCGLPVQPLGVSSGARRGRLPRCLP